MYDNTAMIMMMSTLTPTHAGSGTQLSYVDLPIQREPHTGFPKIEASTLKGCVRHALTSKDKSKSEEINQIFGEPDKGDFASAVAFSDARLLFFPVKSVLGVFAWVTCPLAIQKFMDDYELATGEAFTDLNMNSANSGSGALITESCRLAADNKIMLEDYVFEASKDEKFNDFIASLGEHLPNNTMMKSRFFDHVVMVSDDDFAGFVKFSTEVNSRIKINPATGTVDGAALFTEEFLPAECILYSLIFFTNTHLPQKNGEQGTIKEKEHVRESFTKLFAEDVFQVGADSSLGKGMIMKRLWEKESGADNSQKRENGNKRGNENENGDGNA
ncbi:type III-B CRISPR module RAMP protein Cmr4 [Bacilliculturomica massiliensis]|uniref:type III-B CRISPR module RAMP protein Cmr4 n=1 Tax=Bacilliculturomica massiliensis TaxID=1917867 RepID=UPI001031618D|nr:type III-B CRISPR module RAMP protein Cmr4 [Bacilliculturomica massiliensis]